jgi:hypothetical protein
MMPVVLPRGQIKYALLYVVIRIYFPADLNFTNLSQVCKISFFIFQMFSPSCRERHYYVAFSSLFSEATRAFECSLSKIPPNYSKLWLYYPRRREARKDEFSWINGAPALCLFVPKVDAADAVDKGDGGSRKKGLHFGGGHSFVKNKKHGTVVAIRHGSYAG